MIENISEMNTSLVIQYSVVGLILLAAFVWIGWKAFKKNKKNSRGSCCGCALADSCKKKDLLIKGKPSKPDKL
ncbi:MAG: FeoB-associated Cys-rich membrane protein [Muribaculaceae bacterium]|nr:FeoB-associated Cys-rich membrane protein [Muribaculaceae bacterium]